MARPSAGQRAVRRNFRASCDCFNKQPIDGGVEPPAIGPRNRAWWFTDSGGTDIRYYNYFMHKTLLSYNAGTVPDWCKIPVIEDTFISRDAPDQNFSGATIFYVTVESDDNGSDINRALIKAPSDNPQYALSIYALPSAIALPGWLLAYSVDETAYDNGAVTWNTQPDPISLLDQIYLDSEGWKELNIHPARAILLQLEDESPTGDDLKFRGRSFVAVDTVGHPNKKPSISI